MKQIDWNNVEDAQEFDKVTPGGYVCGITAVSDEPTKEYLKVEYDIAEGSLKDYYRSLYEAKGFWGGSFVRSYKEKAQPFFKGMLTAIENSNKGFIAKDFDGDEKKLVRKLLGLVLAEEEYQAKDGTLKTRLYVAEIRSVESIKKRDFKVPELKKLDDSAPKKTNINIEMNGFEDIDTDDSDMPF